MARECWGCGWLGNATVWWVWVLGGDGVAAAVTEKWSVAGRCVKPKNGRDGAGGFAVWVFGGLDVFIYRVGTSPK